MTLAPGQTTQFDLASQFTQSNPLPNGYGHLAATFQGQDGDIHMETGSVDQSGSYVFEVTPTIQAIRPAAPSASGLLRATQPRTA